MFNSNPFLPLPTGPEQVPISIQLQELQNNNDKFPVHLTTTSEEEEEESPEGDDHIHFSRNGRKNSHGHSIPHYPSQDNMEELPPLTSLTVSGADVCFNGVSCLFAVVGLVLEVLLIFWHYNTGHKWGSAFTALWVGLGGMVLLKRFWGVGQDKLERVYGARVKAVRIWVNACPWLGTIITSWMTTSYCHLSRTNTIHTHQFIQLQDWPRLLLRVQTFAQAAPQAVLQLLLLLEDLESISAGKATTMTLCIVTSLTSMMIGNLPSKSDVVLSESTAPSKAAYSPYSRLFIGLRMMSSFCSRTMCLSLFLSSFRCTSPLHLDSSLLSHLVPLGILLVPRISFALVEFIYLKFRRRSNQDPPPPTFSSTLVTYTASIFFPFGEPRWIFWYITIETLAFIGVGAGLSFWGSCLEVWVGVVYLLLFGVLFGGVPVVLPWLRWLWVKRG